MTASDAFVSDSTHSYNGQCYFVHVDPNLAQLIRDAATVVARVTAKDQGDDDAAAWVDSLVQRAQDALPAAPSPAQDEDSEEEAAPRTIEETPEFKATKRDLVQQLVARLQEGAKLQALADRDFVGFVNSFLSLLLETQADADLTHGIQVLVGAIACRDPKPATTQPALSTRYSTLATIFNALPPSSSLTTLRLQVLRTLVKYAAENDDVAIVKPALDPVQLEQYFAEAGADADETAASLVESLLNNVGGGNGAKAATDPIGTVTLAREILVARLSSSSSAAAASSSSSPVRSKLAATLVALLLASNDVYDFTPYSRVLPISAEATSSLLVETFKKFTDLSSSSSVEQQQADEFASQDELDKAVASTTLFPSSSSSSSESASASSTSAPASASAPRTASAAASAQLLRVDRAHLVKKQNLLRFARLCEDKGVGKSVRYDEIAKRLGLSAKAGGEEEEEEAGEEVETWVIDAIRASLVQGRLSQPTQSFLITRVAPLSFSASSSSSSGSASSSSWQVIQERLEGWKGALDRVTATVEKSLAVSSGAGASQGGARGGRFGAEELVNHQQQQAVEA
ncbi:hypothetical protein B0A53_04403 [Rhodotorula sp. CCFEE 5036]|nr:hypothetical protein B0A53_04403 [Rhodotorula sp. CCFEE 5036]